MTKEKQLDQLLRSLFVGVADMRRWIFDLPGGHSLVDDLPGGSVSKAEFSFQVVERLVASGRVDAVFFDQLVADPLFQGRRADIDRVRQCWAVNPTGAEEHTGDVCVRLDPRWRDHYRLRDAVGSVFDRAGLLVEGFFSRERNGPLVEAILPVPRPRAEVERLERSLRTEIESELSGQSANMATGRSRTQSPSVEPEQPRLALLRDRATIGILTALPKEWAAVQVMLEEAVDCPEGSIRYVLGEIPSRNGGTHAVAVAMLPDMGNNSAALSAQALLGHFPTVRHLIMCGIAGGVPNSSTAEDDVRLGDVVVSNRNGVVQYDMVKLQAGQGPEHRHPPRPPSREMLQAVRNLEADALLGKQPWEAFLTRGERVKKAARPPDDVDSRGQPIAYATDPDREPGLPRVFSGTIAAANALLKDPSIRDRLGREFKVKAVEMEGSGVADAAWFSERSGYLVVRGICDFCDGNKGDLWQGYAAVAAAAYVRALLESMPVAMTAAPSFGLE